MSFTFLQAALQVSKQTFGDPESIDLRCLLVMVGNNALAVRKTAVFVSDITTLAEFDGGGYTVGGQALTNVALAADAANDRIEMTADFSEWNPLHAGSAAVAGAVIYKFVTDYDDSRVYKFFDNGGFPLIPNSGPFKITWSSQGLLQHPCPLS